MPPIPKEQVSRVLPARAVADRYGVHLRSITRWVARGVIPPPDQIIVGRRYWLSKTLEEADRRRTIEAGATERPISHSKAAAP